MQNSHAAIGFGEEYDNDFNPFWHTSADSLGQFNLSFYEKVAKLAYATLGECALDTAFAVGIDELTIDNLLSHHSYPNPLFGLTTIELVVSTPASVSINIYDGQGRLVERVLNNKKLSVGEQQIVWNASQQKSGNYFYEITLTGNENNSMRSVGQLQIIN